MADDDTQDTQDTRDTQTTQDKQAAATQYQDLSSEAVAYARSKSLDAAKTLVLIMDDENEDSTQQRLSAAEILKIAECYPKAAGTTVSPQITFNLSNGKITEILSALRPQRNVTPQENKLEVPEP